MSEFKLAAIGLDTSHTVAFTNILQGVETPEDQKVEGMKVVNAMRFPSVFQAEEGQDGRQKQLEDLGVTMKSSFEDVVEGMDGILLELNDPAMHLEYFSKASEFGLPIFLDKPLAANLEEGKKIFDIAKEKNIRVFSSSSLRFMKDIVEATEKIGDAVSCNAFGPLGKAAKGSDVVWYGIHTIEMLNTIMGNGAKSVFAREDERGVVATVQYGGERRGVAELNRNSGVYGGRVQSDINNAEVFMMRAGGKPLYYYLLVQIADFFLNGKNPVDISNTLEIQAILDAIEKSLNSGNEEAVAL